MRDKERTKEMYKDREKGIDKIKRNINCKNRSNWLMNWNWTNRKYKFYKKLTPNLTKP